MAAPLKWFPFYIDAFETDATVRHMTWEERGVYIALLCWQWRETTVPSRPAFVAKALNARPTVVRRLLRLCFADDGTRSGQLVNRTLAEIYVHQLSKSEKAQRAGQISARKRNGRAAVAEQPSNERPTKPQPIRSRLEIQKEIKESLESADSIKAKAGVA